MLGRGRNENITELDWFLKKKNKFKIFVKTDLPLNILTINSALAFSQYSPKS